jgi:trk system potassium uptake protein TrkH
MPPRSPSAAGRTLKITPPALLALLYAGLIVVGALLLELPLATTRPLSWPDALFTATSAVTVTGLVVVDTGSAFTGFGQAVVMVLIQLGGLGLMTFAVLVLSALGLPIRLPQQHLLREDLNQTSIAELLRLVVVIARVVAACELIGVVLLAIVFVPAFGWAAGMWNALFHTVSAFNNAGFALFPDSLSRWAADPIVNTVVPALFIIGGIGFVVLADIASRRSWRRYALHTKLTLSGTAALIVWSVAVFAVLEWSNPGTLGQFSDPLEKLAASWFQGVTTRTAGFNTVDIAQLRHSTALMMISLMLIGGGSTSTAGGIKVTSFVVLLLATTAFFKRSTTLSAFGRSMGLDDVLKVMALTTLSLLIVMIGTFLVALSNPGDFLDLVFEITSAFGTVGLSRGATGDLDGFGRVVVGAIMFIGRVGPLTLGFLLATSLPPRIRYPFRHVYLG